MFKIDQFIFITTLYSIKRKSAVNQSHHWQEIILGERLMIFQGDTFWRVKKTEELEGIQRFGYWENIIDLIVCFFIISIRKIKYQYFLGKKGNCGLMLK